MSEWVPFLPYLAVGVICFVVIVVAVVVSAVCGCDGLWVVS